MYSQARCPISELHQCASQKIMPPPFPPHSSQMHNNPKLNANTAVYT